MSNYITVVLISLSIHIIYFNLSCISRLWPYFSKKYIVLVFFFYIHFVLSQNSELIFFSGNVTLADKSMLIAATNRYLASPIDIPSYPQNLGQTLARFYLFVSHTFFVCLESFYINLIMLGKWHIWEKLNAQFLVSVNTMKLFVFIPIVCSTMSSWSWLCGLLGFNQRSHYLHTFLLFL